MDIRNELLNAVKKIPRIAECDLTPKLNDEILGGRLGMDSFDFAELIVIMESITGIDPFASISANRQIAKTLEELANLYEKSNTISK